MNPNDNFGVFEVGMNKPNEIFRLSSIIKPNIGLITNVSEAHLENFKNIKGIAKAKSEIIYNVQKGGTIIINKDDKFFNYFKKIAKINKKKISKDEAEKILKEENEKNLKEQEKLAKLSEGADDKVKEKKEVKSEDKKEKKIAKPSKAPKKVAKKTKSTKKVSKK